MQDDDDLFSDALKGVKPIVQPNRVRHRKQLDGSEQKARARQRAEGNEGEMPFDPDRTGPEQVSDDYVEQVKPLDILSFKRPGIQEGVFRKLRLGKYPIDGKLDLHRKTVQEARRELVTFLRDAQRYDARTVLVLHGKGERDPQRPAVLKSHTAKWLREIPEVMAYHSAQQQHGGVGAVYVLLRKSEKLKAENREKHGHRA